MKTKDIVEIWSKVEMQQLENKLCETRIALEELADEMFKRDVTINGKTDWDIQDLADQIAEIENYLFEKDFD